MMATAPKTLIRHTLRSLNSQPKLPISRTKAQYSQIINRYMSSNPLNRPSPPPLPREDQRVFEELVRKAQAPLSEVSMNRAQAEAELAMHPDARAPLPAEFEGEVNPATGETGGPKREPVRQWVEGDGDWSFKGRVSDF